MGWKTIWVDEGECKTCYGYNSINVSIVNPRVVREDDYENTGFCMIYWTNCKCLDCGREWEES